MPEPAAAPPNRARPEALDLSDPGAFERAFDEHAASVREVAMSVLRDGALAEDVVQDVFLRLWRRPRMFDARRGELRPFLRLMARSRALDLLRTAQAAGRARDRLGVALPSEERARADESPPAAVERAGEREAIWSALGRLPAAQREAVVLSYWGGLTAEQIAHRSDIPLGTVKSRVRLALGRLHREFEAADGPSRAAA
jgi:RNA polymerase sigma-70 factor (ECF subfamily)